MAIRGSTRLLQGFRAQLSGQVRNFGGSARSRQFVRPLMAAVGVGTTAVGAYTLFKNGIFEAVAQKCLPKVSAAGVPESQPSVWSQEKNHALYLWIDLNSKASNKEVAKVAAKLQKMVDMVSDPSMRGEEDEILAGVGFGPNFYKQVGGKPKKNYTYPHRKCKLGDLPSTGGDVFVHAKCNTPSKLFELAHLFLRSLPAGSVKNHEDIYSFVYKNGRDLSGFIDGTENAADAKSRQKIAVEKETGGSYVITQKWIHNMEVLVTEKEKTLESWIGRSKPDSTELCRKANTSHVARMVGGTEFSRKKPVEIVRQSMPFGNLSNECGLFFIGYAESPEKFEYLLDRMAGVGGDGQCDDIMWFSKNVKGTYWYFPGQDELKKFL